jgi:uncharacterized protein (UPF0333 family)
MIFTMNNYILIAGRPNMFLLKRISNIKNKKRGAVSTLEILVVSTLLLFFIIAPIAYFNIVMVNMSVSTAFNATLNAASLKGGCDESTLSILQTNLASKGLVSHANFNTVGITCTSGQGRDLLRNDLVYQRNPINDDYIIYIEMNIPDSGWYTFLNAVNRMIGVNTEQLGLFARSGFIFSQLDDPNYVPLIGAEPITGAYNPGGEHMASSIDRGTHFTSSIYWESIYSAIITLEADLGFTFYGDFLNDEQISGFTVNDKIPEFISNDGKTLVFRVYFP